MNRLAQLLLATTASAVLAGCGSPSPSRTGGVGTVDPGLNAQGGPAASEMAELCALQRDMMGKTPEAQEAMLEAHMQAAHGSVNPQVMAMHRREMGRCNSR